MSKCAEVGTHCRHVRWGMNVKCCYCAHEDGQWVVNCLETGVSTCGDTQEEALANLEDARAVYREAVAEARLVMEAEAKASLYRGGVA